MHLSISSHRLALLVLAALFSTLAHGIDARACDAPPSPVRDLDLARYYADGVGSVVDPIKKAEHEAATRPVREWLNRVVKSADSALRAGASAERSAHARCASEWLVRWATGRALLGTMTSKQAEAEQRWTLAGAALAYLKVKALLEARKRTAIEAWLGELADTSAAAFAASGAKHNNHAYWLALGQGATAIATGRDDLWLAARATMLEAAREIAADGTLPLELARGQRALHYHAFAAMPLVTLALLAESRGEEWTALGDRALERLVRVTAQGLADPRLFDRLANATQERPVKPGSGWLPLWEAWHGPPDISGVPHMKPSHRWLGGNVLLLCRAIGRCGTG